MNDAKLTNPKRIRITLRGAGIILYIGKEDSNEPAAFIRG